MDRDETLAVDGLQRTVEFPPLRVHHFLLWTVVAAVWFTMSRHEFDDGQLHASGDRAYVAAEHIGMKIVETLAITVCIIGLLGQRKGFRFPSQPGHWIALAIATFAVPTTFFGRMAEFFGNDWRRWSDDYILPLLFAVWTVVFFLLAMRKPDTPSWRTVYFLLGLLLACMVTMALLWAFYSYLPSIDPAFTAVSMLSGIVLTVLAVTALIAMATDRLFLIRRDWGHWASVLSLFGMGTGMACWAIALQLFARLGG
ncbi:MAG: hypothetical protein WD851_04745 [Pirellulales bacterium]